MKIISLELSGYRRLSLRHIKYLKITPKQMVQLILGTNSSGKSSLMFELSPLPGSDKEYEKGGFKIITIVHRNSTYVLKSLFPVSGKKFHFFKDEEDLNPTGSITLYLELVKKEFGYTRDIHDLMLGLVRFHSMDIATRRQWLTRLSEQDYTYALSYYKRLQEQLRDAVGAQRVLSQRMVQASTKLMTAEDEVKVKKDIQDLNDIINMLLDQKSGKSAQTYEIHTEIEQRLRASMDHFSDLCNQQQDNHIKCDLPSLEDVISRVATLKTELTVLEKNTKQLLETCDKDKKTLSALKQAGIDSFETIENHINEFKKQINEIEKIKNLGLVFDDADQALAALDAVSNQLSEIFGQLEINDQGQFSVKVYQDCLEADKKYTSSIELLNKQLNAFKLEKQDQEHQRDHNKLECPRCKHTWSKGFSEVKYRQIENNIRALINQLEKTEKDQQQNLEKLQAVKTYLELFKSYTYITRAWNILKPLWDHLVDSRTIFDNPSTVVYVLSELKNDILLDIEIKNLLAKIKDHENIRELTSKDQQLNLAKIQENIDKADELFSDYRQQINSKSEELKVREKFITDYKDFVSTYQQFQRQFGKLNELHQALLDSKQRDILNNFIQHFKILLSEKEHLLALQSTQRALVDNMKQQIAELETKQKVLSVAIRALSPTEGLIAKNMTGSINHFVRQINNFIKQIWTYPLELVPIQPDDEDNIELDYRFEIRVNESPVPVPDIKNGSTAAREIIDLAFKRVAIKYLNLGEMPLYLDEFAASFDKAHRQAAINVVKQLIATGNFSQVFMISHYEESFGSFSNTDMTVLCNENLGIPSSANFNQVTEIVYG